MIGQSATIVRVKETLGFLSNRLERETFTIRGTILGVQENGGRVTAVEINGVRAEDGSRRRSWYAVGEGAASGLVVSHTDSLDACGHGITDDCTCATVTAAPEVAQGSAEEPKHTCGPGIQWGCDVPDCDGDNGD